ncbi:Bor/Iss family lipoprotein [Aquimarina sp. 2201CG14-23]|uniref:Bor/Iss family lipoprotein n=1 Tax=Aquimarina mycalae TaxID=3040073 RepID=UPI0024780B42|nr:hypothetical protein [Aquimarina sp. 2201CG14-23]MDH7444692.1 hypothetical protein [Aquimarina sp. 2201CG14-23]
MKRKLKQYMLVLFVLIGMSSCMSTKVIGSYHSNTLDNEECQTVSHWKYWWGIGGTDEILVQTESKDTECYCENNALASVEVRSSFGDFLLTLVTLGMVNHRTIKYECAETDEGEQQS